MDLEMAWRTATANLRARPDFVILGAQRGGTTSLYSWLAQHPQVDPARKKELHYFDVHYARGPRWYRANFPLARRGHITGEASPYLLFHPLAPARAAAGLPASTRFIVLLREPVQRTVSHYWYSRRRAMFESESFERAIQLEPERLAGEIERVLRGERSANHSGYSYVARSEYVGQLQAWFDAVGRDRILIVEFERMCADPSVSADIVRWLGLAPHDQEFPMINQSTRLGTESPEVLARLREHFEPYNRKLFDLLGRELWTGQQAARPPGVTGPGDSPG
jgi:Sulfotransferase domain